MDYGKSLAFYFLIILFLTINFNCANGQTSINPLNHLFSPVKQNNNSFYHPHLYSYWSENETWVEIGPISSSEFDTWDVGRLSCIEIDPGNDSIVLAGSPSGGLYYTLNKGETWINAGLDRPNEIHGLDIFTPGISSIVIIHDNNKTYWIIATGDKDHNFSYSRGIIRSDDYGTSWNLLNGVESNHLPGSNYFIRKLVRHHANPNILYAATSKGVYKTTNALEYRG